MKLKKYWISFKKNTTPTVFNLGCGATASDRIDLQKVLDKSEILSRYPNLSIDKIEQISKIDELESKHVLVNMGNPAVRGIWFPLGF